MQEAVYFAFSATLRIHGHGLNFDEISHVLGVNPTHKHVDGGSPRVGSASRFKDDAWHYQANVAESEPLGAHLSALWSVVGPHAAYLRDLMQSYRVDVFCGYRSNCDHAGFEVPSESLRIFTELGIPFGVSVIFAGE